MRSNRSYGVLALALLAGLGVAQAQQALDERNPPAAQPGPYPAPAPFPLPFPDPTAREMMIRGAEQIVRALELMLRAFPTYDPPIVTPEGDIIIRRHRGPAKPLPDVDRTAQPVPGATEL